MSMSLYCPYSQGSLKGLLDQIKASNDTLVLCFRRNYINVYFLGHSLFKLEEVSPRTYKVSFDFNHARFTRNWQEILTQLNALGYQLHKNNHPRFPYLKPNKKTGHIETHSQKNDLFLNYPPKTIPPAFWETSISILRQLISDYFSEETIRDYFKDAANLKQSPYKHRLLEKERQQQIMTANRDLAKEYYIYDMEYTQPRNNKTETASGRFDMLAIRKTDVGTHKLVLIELKCKNEACTSKTSGITIHLEDFNRYTINTKLIDVRIEEALVVYEHYKRLFNLSEPCPPTLAGAELLFIFTDESETYFKNDSKLPLEQKIFLSNPYQITYPRATT